MNSEFLIRSNNFELHWEGHFSMMGMKFVGTWRLWLGSFLRYWLLFETEGF